MVEERQKGGDALDGQQTVATSSGKLISSHCQTAVHESAHGAGCVKTRTPDLRLESLS
jgi:hypothetical protein